MLAFFLQYERLFGILTIERKSHKLFINNGLKGGEIGNEKPSPNVHEKLNKIGLGKSGGGYRIG